MSEGVTESFTYFILKARNILFFLKGKFIEYKINTVPTKPRQVELLPKDYKPKKQQHMNQNKVHTKQRIP